MDSRNVNFSIKKSQIDTHMLGLSQKLAKLDIAWKDKCCMGFWVWFPKNDPEWAFVYILYVFTAFSTPYWRLFCSAPSVVNLVSWSGKNWVGPCLYLEDLSQSLNWRWIRLSLVYSEMHQFVYWTISPFLDFLFFKWFLSQSSSREDYDFYD